MWSLFSSAFERQYVLPVHALNMRWRPEWLRSFGTLLGGYTVDEERITDVILLHADNLSTLMLRLAEATFRTIYLNLNGKIAAIWLVVTKAEYSSHKRYRSVMVADSRDTMLNDRSYIFAATILRRLRIEADYDLDSWQICGQVKRPWKHTASH
jgi:hypothetical protein